MSRLNKSVRVTYVPERDRWQVDYYDLNGKRKRLFRDSEAIANKEKEKIESALLFEQDLKLRGMVVVDEKRNSSKESAAKKLVEIEIKDAIKKYREITKPTLTEDSFNNDKYYFKEFYAWCVEDRIKFDPKTSKPLNEALIYMDQLTPLEVSEYQSFLIEKGNSPATVNRKFNTLKPFFNKALEWGFIAKDLTLGVKTRRVERKIGRKVWSGEQIHQVLMGLGLEAADMFTFLAALGCRPGQGFKLTWEHVDWKERTVKVFSIKGGVRREIVLPLSDDLCAFMRQKFEMARRQFKARPEDLVFENSKGRKWTRTSFGKAVRIAGRAQGFEGLVPYGLRHTVITELLRANVNHRKVQLLAGHAKFETTTIYAQSMQGDQLHAEVNELSRIRKLI